ncbi:CJH_07325 family protein [Campylobacter jejuni]|nr:CJH_07325 family protein [Campylobacter jejuni]EKK2071689.1 CJH_07325 family protein [Campylobacter jejuni]EKP0078140.1 CJH_07325 family protein [Campylobacter jejuni]ELL4702638.1 CJH_07325 family protein [Campylobacter jejuni]ELL4711171.1 CJH_07325 family protein [Campylobacter jejuni]
MKKGSIRDSYGKINYINDFYNNHGSVAQLTYGKDNPKLHQSLQEANDFLDKMYEKYNVEEKIANKNF